MKQCPICNTHVTMIYERTESSTWAGRYWCHGCHVILSACGSIVHRDERSIRAWTPVCPESGAHIVVRPNGNAVDAFRCVDCGREFRRNGNRIEQIHGRMLAAV